MTHIDPETMEVRHTQGDTFEVPLKLYVGTGEQREEYVPAEGDVIRIAIKGSYRDEAPIIRKVIPHTMIIRIEAEETELLQARSKPYVYDIQLKTPAGFVRTVLDRKQWYSTEEVD